MLINPKVKYKIIISDQVDIKYIEQLNNNDYVIHIYVYSKILKINDVNTLKTLFNKVKIITNNSTDLIK